MWEGLCSAGVIWAVVELVGEVPEVRDRLAACFADVASGLVCAEQRRN